MKSKKIANEFKLLGQISELLGENSFKVRSYQNAYRTIRSGAIDWMNVEKKEMLELKGIGNNIADKIIELRSNGKMKALESRLERVPEGVVQLLKIKGLGPKKIRALWKELNITSPEELYYACLENHLTLLKGFGEKTQKNIQEKVSYFLKSKNKRRLADVYHLVQGIQDKVNAQGLTITPVGAYRRKCNTLESLEWVFIGNLSALESIIRDWEKITDVRLDESGIEAKWEDNFPLIFYAATADNYEELVLNKTVPKQFDPEEKLAYKNEGALFKALGYKEVLPELLDWNADDLPTVLTTNEQLLELKDIRGLVHCHSTYSDGRNTVEQMAKAAQSQGLEYMVITDHSQSAFYAGGLKETDIIRQHEEINAWNAEHDRFHIFKGIESDIKSDGSLDYPDEVLEQFDVVIASIHSQLNMDEKTATKRLITAIKNPYTTILGHPTSRLLLGRKGYPVDMHRVIESCAEYGVAIELNANPWRLDIDWKWIPLCKSLGVPLLICPDAHDTEGIDDIQFGVMSARKGGLTSKFCWNTLSKSHFQELLSMERVNRLSFINNL